MRIEHAAYWTKYIWSKELSMNIRVGFIGAGKMAGAILEGLLNNNVISKNNLLINDKDEKRMYYFKSLGVNICEKDELVKKSDLIILSVKPIHMKEVCDEIKVLLNKNKIILSIAAGITISYLEKYLSKEIQIVRVMPNTPALVNKGMSVYCYNDQFDKKNQDVIEELLKNIGEVVYCDEKYFDAVTGLSGSGPAYIFVVINALAEGGLRMGLPKDLSLTLATQTVLGSAELVAKTRKHPEELKDMVSSPGGTTVEGLKVLEDYKVRAAFIEAVEKATLKSKNLIKD